MTDAIDLTTEQRNQLSALLRRFLPGVAVWAYGSRVRWTARPNSDLDLVAFTTPAQQRQVADLKDALAESNLPFPVDLHVWDDVPERFREIIRKEYVVVQKAKPPKEPVMLDGWRTKTVWELQQEGVLLVEDGNHGEYRPRSDEFVSSGVAFIRAADMDGGRVVFDSASKINDTARQRITKGIGAPGDVLLSHKGTVGKMALVHSNAPAFVCSPQTTFWRTLDEEHLDRKYLYAFLRSPEFLCQLATRSGETDMAPYVSLTSQRGLSVKLPPIQEQRAIAHILGTLDDKIELNRKMNETLEAMARALFKSWFVDFDPVRAKAQGRDPGLPKHIADLFPDSFEDSELGEIPKGWKVKPLSDLTSYFSRGIGPSYIDEGGVCVLNQKCIRDRRVNFSESRRHDSTKRPIEGRELRALDILVNSTGIGTLGRVAQVWYLPETAIVDSHVTVVRAANDVNPWFFGVALLYREREIEELGEGSTGQTELSRARLGALTCLVPTVCHQVAFGKIASQLLLRIAENGRGSLALEAVRDTLLSKLISGELRVKDAERFMERAV